MTLLLVYGIYKYHCRTAGENGWGDNFKVTNNG